MPSKSFKADLLKLRPDAAEDLRRNETKRKLAQALRALRKEKGLTQRDIEDRSTLSQPVISRLEAPTGALPNWDTVMRYVEACNGHMLLSLSTRAFDQEALAGTHSDDGDMLVALAV